MVVTKPKCFLLLVFLDFYRTSLAASAINESEVKNYVVKRRDKPDLFTVNMKDGLQCTAVADDVYKWCKLFSASHDPSSWLNASSCSCACSSDNPSFLPSLQMCISRYNTTLAAKFGGCRNYFDVKKLLQSPVDLQSNGSWETPIRTDKNDCCLRGHFFDFNGFQSKWLNMIDGIFSLGTQGEHNNKFYIVWAADTARKLSGRIIRLNLTCISKTGQQQSIRSRCMLFKALGTVTYYSSTSESSVKQSSSYSAVPTTVDSRIPSPSVTYSSPPPQPPSLSHVPPLPPQSLTLTSPSLAFTTSMTTSAPSGIPSFFSSSHSQTSSLHTRPTLVTSGPIDISTSRTELQSSLPFQSEEVSNQVVSTGIPVPITSMVGPDPVEPSKSSTDTASSSAVINGPGGKRRQTDGNDNGVVIGAAVGGAVVFGIFLIVIILFYKRRKLSGKSKEKATKLEVKNPVYGKSDNDIQMAKTRGKQVLTSNDEDNQPTYQGLSIDSGQINGAALYSSPEDNYDNYTTYQSLDKNIPGSPVYQSLKKGQAATGHPNTKSKPSTTGQPVYNVLKQPGTEQGNTEESLYNVLEGPDAEKDYEATERDNHWGTQDPLYNVLDGPDAEQNYEAVNVGNASADPPLYNVVEGPESTQDRQEPLYNVLGSPDAENSPPGRQGPYHGSNNEPLYNVVEGPDSGEPNKSSADYATPNGPPDGQDNPAYEQTLGFDAPYASVHRPGPQRENVYEPLGGPDRHDLYEPLNKRGT